MYTYIKKRRKWFSQILSMLFLVCILTFLCATPVYASSTKPDGVIIDEIEDATVPDEFNLNISSNLGSTTLSSTLQIILVLTVLSIAPSILLMVTSFTRIIVVLHFTRSAIGTQTTPPNQVLIALSLFLTIFIMSPVFSEINKEAIQPLANGEILQDEALEKGIAPLKKFMLEQIGDNRKDLRLFMDIAEIESVSSYEEIPITVVIPAFMINELRAAFIIGFIIYIPFIIIDMVVASTLMSMGMMMLPPTTISMPFKILLFVIADGWNLIIGKVVETFFPIT